MRASRAFLVAGAIALTFIAIVGAWAGFRLVNWFALLTGFGVFVAVIFPIAIAVTMPVLLFEIVAPWLGTRVRKGTIGGMVGQFIKASFGVPLAVGMLAGIMAPWLLALLGMGVLGKQQYFDGG